MDQGRQPISKLDSHVNTIKVEPISTKPQDNMSDNNHQIIEPNVHLNIQLPVVYMDDNLQCQGTIISESCAVNPCKDVVNDTPICYPPAPDIPPEPPPI